MRIITRPVRVGDYCDANKARHKFKCQIRAVAERLPDGNFSCPTLDFFHDQFILNPDHVARLSALLTTTAREGPIWIESKFKHVKGTDGLLEFKYFQLRLFCFQDGGDLIICTNGTIKKREPCRSRCHRNCF